MNLPSWVYQSIFYHIYPLGMFGAQKLNHFSAPAENRLENLYSWLDHLQWLGVNALYLGPIFESEQHGYDTTDYFKIDRRLGDEQSFKRLADDIHRRGIRIILDGVFNHVGRSHFAFRDVQMHGEHSAYVSWFSGMDFSQYSPYGDPFMYDTWDGHYNLPKLNLENPPVRDHLLSAVRQWMETWQIDGLRLDAADVLDFAFIQELNTLTKSLNPQFWLMGEVVHGNYADWVKNGHLDAVTNYECYKGLYSSLNEKNYFEIAYALKRQFGTNGVYQNFYLYNFVDNHDVNRIGSQLKDARHLFPLYGLLFTMPGVPSLYYGSEWGITGERTPSTDEALRPLLDLNTMINKGPVSNLPHWIRKLAEIRKKHLALTEGDYQEILVEHEVLVFQRSTHEEMAYILLNASDQAYHLKNMKFARNGVWKDVLTDQEFTGEVLNDLVIPPFGTCILVYQ